MPLKWSALSECGKEPSAERRTCFLIRSCRKSLALRLMLRRCRRLPHSESANHFTPFIPADMVGDLVDAAIAFG
jgi:hypothetical protein